MNLAKKLGAMLLLAAAVFGGTCGVAQAEPVNTEHWRWGLTDESLLRSSIISRVTIAVNHEDFAALDALALEFRGVNGNMPSGASQLELFHAAVATQLAQGIAPGTCEGNADGFLQRWEEAAPGSPARILAQARILSRRAWCYRGDGYASTVPAGGWQPFQDNTAAARSVLDKGRSAASVDPEFYAALLDLAIDQGRPRAEFDRLLDEASKRFPYYYGLYFAAQRANLPAWGGSLAAIDKGARYAVSRTRPRDGTSAYVRIYWHAVVCRCYDQLEAMDWPMMKTAMTDLATRYPADWNYVHLIQLSCLRGDADEARKYFDRLTVNQVGSWTPEEWKTCRALVGRSAEGFQF